jgi:hypothetical protein
MNSKRTFATASAVTSIAASVVLGLASPANAAGGGCNTYTQTPGGTVGWNIGVCSSDNGRTVYGDGYLNNRGSVGPTGCNVTLQVVDITEGYAVKVQRTDGCYTGHHPAISTQLVSGHRYRTNVKMNNYSTNTYWYSPVTW